MASLREALGAAMDGDTPAEETVVDTTPAETTEVVEAAPAEDAAPVVAGERVRDGLGRFVPKDATSAPAAPEAPGAAAAPEAALPLTPAPTEAPAPAYAAPVSWKAEAKAEWAKLPPQVQAEVSRRELDVQRTLSESDSARSIAKQFTETVTPYLPFMRAEGAATPLDAIRNVFDIVVRMRTGSAFEKAGTIKQLMDAYGVDVATLDGVLVGAAQEDPQLKMQQLIERQVAQRMQPFQQIVQQAEAAKQAQMEAVGQEVDAELAAFQQSRPHFETVKGLMADLMEAGKRNQIDLSLADAYEQAMRLHPSTKGVTLAAQTAQTAAQLNEAAQRAKRAAVGGRVQAQSTAVPAGEKANISLRGAIAQAMQDVPLA